MDQNANQEGWQPDGQYYHFPSSFAPACGSRCDCLADNPLDAHRRPRSRHPGPGRLRRLCRAALPSRRGSDLATRLLLPAVVAGVALVGNPLEATGELRIVVHIPSNQTTLAWAQGLAVTREEQTAAVRAAALIPADLAAFGAETLARMEVELALLAPKAAAHKVHMFLSCLSAARFRQPGFVLRQACGPRTGGFRHAARL